MARVQQTKNATAESSTETVAPVASTPQGASGPDGSPLPPLVPQGTIIPRRVRPRALTSPATDNPESDSPIPVVPPSYRVVKGGRVVHHGGSLPATIHEGKIIDARNYDLDGLRKQGIVLELVEH